MMYHVNVEISKRNAQNTQHPSTVSVAYCVRLPLKTCELSNLHKTIYTVFTGFTGTILKLLIFL